MIYNIRIPEIERFEKLSKSIVGVMEDLLLRSLNKTEDMIRNLIEIELGYINTNHPDFIDVISLVKNDKVGKKEDFGHLSFDSEPNRDPPSEDENKSSSNFRFKKRDVKSPAE